MNNDELLSLLDDTEADLKAMQQYIEDGVLLSPKERVALQNACDTILFTKAALRYRGKKK